MCRFSPIHRVAMSPSKSWGSSESCCISSCFSMMQYADWPVSTTSASSPSSFSSPKRTMLLTPPAASRTSASTVKQSPLRGLALNNGLGEKEVISSMVVEKKNRDGFFFFTRLEVESRLAMIYDQPCVGSYKVFPHMSSQHDPTLDQ